MADIPGSSGHEPAGGDAAGSALSRALDRGQFVVTAEIGPPRGASTAPVARKAAALRGWVTAANVTDNARATARLASWAGSLAALDAGVEPIMQVTGRDRNRIALQSDLLGAAALGIPNLLIMTGDHPRHGDHADATAVFDLDGAQILRVARAMRDEGVLMSGRELTPPPWFLLGAVANPAGPVGPAVAAFATKVEAGAQFTQTQYVFDVPAFAAWLDEARRGGLTDRCRVLAGVGPLLSHRALHSVSGLPGVHLPDEFARRLTAAGDDSPDRFRAAGIALAAEIIRELRQLPGLAGVHLFGPGTEAVLPDILTQAGLERAHAD
jgi:methylenetetrahydrofolate reductase (NADPH)